MGTYFPVLTALQIAVLTRFSISAPLKPGHIYASFFDSMESSFAIFARYKSKMSVLPFKSGRGT